jgi:hypothetical protein
MEIMEKLMTQSTIRFLIELTRSAPKNAKENPAIRALIKAGCLYISV